MIRRLLTVAVAGLLISGLCLALAGVQIARSIRSGEFAGWGPWFDEDAFVDPAPTETRRFDWTGSDELSINVPAEVVYIQGPNAGISITGPGNRLDRILVERGNIDIIRRSPRILGNELKIEVEAPSVRYFEFNGAQDVQIIDFDQEVLRIEANGAASIEAYGRARIARLNSNGAGSIDLAGLTLTDLEIDMNGAGEVDAGPTGSADIEINGAGEVTLLGQPASVEQQVRGMGQIHIRDRPAAVSPPATGAAP